MTQRRYILLEVEDARAEELLAVLGKRSYIKVLALDRKERQQLGKCPACSNPFPEEKAVSISHKLVEGLISIAERMQSTRSVLLFNGKSPKSQISEHEHPRCIEMDQISIEYAVNAGLLHEGRDGKHRAFYLSKKALAFLSGEAVSPSRLIFADGKLVGVDTQPTDITKVKIKDRVARDRLISHAKRVVRQLPAPILEFIEKGQVPILI